MIPTNLDVTQLFPYPGEPAIPALKPASLSSSSDSLGKQVAAPADQQKADADAAALLTDSLAKLNASLMNFGLEFEISEVDKRLITRVVDRETGDLIRQIPSEEALRIARSLDKTSGLLLQTTA